jgi:hypothetical protein
MTFAVVSGDPLATSAQVLIFGYNARGRAEVQPLQMALMQRHPAAFASFGKAARAGRITAGMLWLWRESAPWLGFAVVRESAVGPARVRHAQSVALRLARDYTLEGMTSVAVAGMCTAGELPPIREAFAQWLDGVVLRVEWYE